MARLLIFDSQPLYTTKSDGTLIGSQFTLGDALAVTSARRSNPVRCFGSKEETRLVGIEWLLDRGLLEGAARIYAFRWWPEYFSDKAALSNPPSNRDWKGVNVATPWARGMVANDGGGGNVDLNALTYRMNMWDRLSNPTIEADCLYVPISVHTLWMRVAIYCDLTASTNLTQDALAAARLRAYAVLGNHDEVSYLEENGDKIYAYNAYKS